MRLTEVATVVPSLRRLTINCSLNGRSHKFWILLLTSETIRSFLLRDARSAKRGITIVSRPSARLFVCNAFVPLD